MKIVYSKVKYYEREVHSDEHDKALKSLEDLKAKFWWSSMRIEKNYDEYGWTLRALNCVDSCICSCSGNWEEVSEEEREVEKMEPIFVEYDNTNVGDDYIDFKLYGDL